MSEECSHNCADCQADCASRNNAESLKQLPNEASRIGHVIGVVSGKGGVGKSLVTCMLGVLLRRLGYKVGILDADVTGPSIPQAFGIHNVNVYGDEHGMIPPSTKTGIDLMSVNLLIGDDETKPVVWRGSLIAGTVGQFWHDTVWDCDVLLVDCPPGTGDVPLTVFQTMPLDGVVVVTSPQDLVSMIVSKAANMAKMMNVQVLGLVENMSYVRCPDCGKEIRLFGESQIQKVADAFGYDVLARLPLDAEIAKLVDKGLIEMLNTTEMDEAVDRIIKKIGLEEK